MAGKMSESNSAVISVKVRTLAMVLAVLACAIWLFAIMSKPVDDGKPTLGMLKYHARATTMAAFSPDVDVVFIGDSLTRGLEWSDVFPDITVANRGIDGDSARGILGRLDPILLLNAEKAFIQLGINDFLGGPTPHELLVTYTKIVERLEEEGIKVFIQSTHDCNEVTCYDGMREKISMLNVLLKDYAAAHDVTFIDINQGIATPADGLLEEYTFDGVHLNAQAYKIWMETITPYVLD